MVGLWWLLFAGFLTGVRSEQPRDTTRAALADLERTTPVTPPDESFRDLEAWVTDGHFAFYRAWTCQAARRALQALIQEPFGTVYSKDHGAKRVQAQRVGSLR